MPHKNHKCLLDLGSDSMVPKNYWPQCCRRLRKLCLVSEHHPETSKYFSSYTIMVAERQRHLSEGDSWLIHPFSVFSLFWKSISAIVDLLHMFVSSLRLAFILERSPIPEHHFLDHILLVLHMLCLADLVMTFHVGYVERPPNVVLDRTAIARRYIKFWFWVDLLSSLPISYVLISVKLKNMVYLYVAHFLAIGRAARICQVMTNLKNFMKLFGGSYIVHGCIQITILYALSVHLCSCLIYLSPVSNFYWYGNWPQGFNHVLNMNSERLAEFSVFSRYSKGMFISLSSFLGTAFTLFIRFQPDEVVIHSLIIMYSALFMLYCLVFLIKIYLTNYNSLMRYHELMDQVKEYMKHKHFPAQLKETIIAFYHYKYWGTYFREEMVFRSLSEQLGDEINMYTSLKLLTKASLLDGLPAGVVGAVLGRLHPEVYLPNDLVVRAGDLGECMYFIASGTVAVYSLQGVEVCHLEDGAHFGEVALLMKGSKRVATVTAIENTQVYRLDAEDFRYFITTYKVLYERIEAVATQRMHETLLLDEAFHLNKQKMQREVQNEF